MKYGHCVFQLAGLILGGLALTSCGSGGSSDGGTTSQVASPTQTIISGTVMAPGGAIAFFKQSSLGDLFVSESYAALTGLANVPDNTVVQLARLNANATNESVITTTTTSEGRYSFNLTTLGLQPSNDLIVRIEGSGGKQMHAFVVGSAVDISPVSEAAYQLATQALNGRPLSNLTLQEVADISGAVGLISMLQDVGSATSVDQAVGVVKAAVGANAQVTGFITAAATAGQTSQGTGDVGNFYPFQQGNIWRYSGIRSVSGPSTTYENTVLVSGQGPAPIYGVNSTIFSESNDEGDNRAEKSYGVKGPSGITAYGNDDPGDNITRQLVPFQAVHFPLSLGVTTVLTERSGLDWGEDEDGDGRNETVNVKLLQTVLAIESVTVSAGTFPIALKIEQKAVFIVMFTTGGNATLIQINTTWHVSGVGEVKGLVQAQVEGGPVVGSLTEELLSYIVNGQGGGFRIQVTPNSTSTILGGTQQLTATAFDQTNKPIPDFTFIWSSSNESVASIDTTGLVTGRVLGQASVQATAGSILSNPVPVTVQDIRLINLETSDLIYDNSRQRIYATVPSRANNNPDRILVINPQSATVTQTIFVGDDPEKLAISDNNQYLYVSVTASTASVRRINLSTGQVDLSFSVGTNIATGQLRVDDMKVIPGSPQSLVVARMYTGTSPRHAGTAVFDNGVMRTLTGPLGESTNLIEFGATPTRLYGADRESSGNTLSILNIGASGISRVGVGCCSFDGQFDAGFIYTKNGQIIDPELMRVVGVLPGTSPLNYRNDDLIVTAPLRGRIYLLKVLDGGSRLLAFDRTSLQQIGAADLSPPLISMGSPTTSLILWGSDGLAFRDGFSNNLLLLRTSILQ
jgi:hypothetical protein